MKAFISYSHNDSLSLELLHKHFKQMQRENLISTWTDSEIQAGGKLNASISKELESSNLFIALLSPDYIASNYCYEREFTKALEMSNRNELIIIPVVLEDCDWLNTPFKEFKALPKDGKAISLWENKNTAFLDVIQNIRKLLTIKTNKDFLQPDTKKAASPSRNYKVQKDFDSIEKMEFIEESFSKIKDILTKYINEIIHIDKIKARILLDTKDEFHCMIVNRNKIDAESTLKFFVVKEKQQNFSPLKNGELSYEIENSKRAHSQKNFLLAYDDYHLFWSENEGYGMARTKNEWNYRNMAEKIWNELLENVGIF